MKIKLPEGSLSFLITAIVIGGMLAVVWWAFWTMAYGQELKQSWECGVYRYDRTPGCDTCAKAGDIALCVPAATAAWDQKHLDWWTIVRFDNLTATEARNLWVGDPDTGAKRRNKVVFSKLNTDLSAGADLTKLSSKDPRDANYHPFKKKPINTDSTAQIYDKSKSQYMTKPGEPKPIPISTQQAVEAGQ